MDSQSKNQKLFALVILSLLFISILSLSIVNSGAPVVDDDGNEIDEQDQTPPDQTPPQQDQRSWWQKLFGLNKKQPADNQVKEFTHADIDAAEKKGEERGIKKGIKISMIETFDNNFEYIWNYGAKYIIIPVLISWLIIHIFTLFAVALAKKGKKETAGKVYHGIRSKWVKRGLFIGSAIFLVIALKNNTWGAETFLQAFTNAYHNTCYIILDIMIYLFQVKSVDLATTIIVMFIGFAVLLLIIYIVFKILMAFIPSKVKASASKLRNTFRTAAGAAGAIETGTREGQQDAE